MMTRRGPASPRLEAKYDRALRATNEAVVRAIGSRDAMIRDAIADGVPAAKVAAAAGLTRQRVYQIAGAA